MCRYIIAVVSCLILALACLYETVKSYKAYRNKNSKFFVLGKSEWIIQNLSICCFAVLIALNFISGLKIIDIKVVGISCPILFSVGYILQILRFVNASRVNKSTMNNQLTETAHKNMRKIFIKVSVVYGIFMLLALIFIFVFSL